MIGRTLTVADLAAYFELQTLELIDYTFDDCENIIRWMEMMKGINEIKEVNANYNKMVHKMKRLKASL
jgi:glutathione S-transferase